MNLSKERILIVDDEEIACFTIEEMVSDLGEVKIAHTSADAISIARTFKPDIILLDIYVGDDNGFDIRKEIISFLPNTSIIYITTSESLALDAYTNGGVDFITKPINFELAYNRVKNQLTLAHSKRELHIANERNVKMLNSLDVAIILTNAGGVITEASKEAASVTGYSIEEMDGMSLEEAIIIKEKNGRKKDIFREIIETKEDFNSFNRFNLISRTEEKIEVSVQAKPILDTFGNICNVSFIINRIATETENTKILSRRELRARTKFLAEVILKEDSPGNTLFINAYKIKNLEEIVAQYGQEVLHLIKDSIIDKLNSELPALSVAGFKENGLFLTASVQDINEQSHESSIHRNSEFEICYLGEVFSLRLQSASSHYPFEDGSLEDVILNTFNEIG